MSELSRTHAWLSKNEAASSTRKPREFARVLRSQILLKDLQRIVIDAGPDDAAPLASDAVIEATVESELQR